MNQTTYSLGLKHLLLVGLSGWVMGPLHANPSQREPNERARREADNPMRIIVEAATVKRAARSVAVVPPASPAKRQGSESDQAWAKPAPITVITATRKPAAPATNAPAEEATLSTSLADALTPTAASAPDAKADSTPSPQQTNAAAPTKQQERPAPVLRLTHRVNPVVPQRVQSQIVKDTEVRVRLGIDPDGLVYRVELLTQAPEGLEAPIQNALRRWRFEPVSDPVSFTVTLVFKPEE